MRRTICGQAVSPEAFEVAATDKALTSPSIPLPPLVKLRLRKKGHFTLVETPGDGILERHCTAIKECEAVLPMDVFPGLSSRFDA